VNSQQQIVSIYFRSLIVGGLFILAIIALIIYLLDLL